MSNLSTPESLAGDRRGIAAIEYALIAAFMSVALVAALPGLKTALTTNFTSIGGHIATGK